MRTDTPEAFKERVIEMATRHRIPFPLAETDILLKKVEFLDENGSVILTTWGDGSNRSSRLFLADANGKGGGSHKFPLEPIRYQMARFYGYYWTDRPGLGVHPFIDASKVAVSARLTYFKDPGTDLQIIINEAWDNRDNLGIETKGVIRDAVNHVLRLLDRGEARIAELTEGSWHINQWLKKAVLLSFKLNDNVVVPGPGDSSWFDKVPSKFIHWNEANFRGAGFRAVPGAIVRHGAYIGPKVILMPSFVNIGAYVGEGTMIDTWATVGSCAQIGKNCHISGGAGIGGVLEPLQANPVIIGDNVFIGARSEIVEGVRVGDGAVIGMGVFIGASTKIVDRQTGETTTGEVPPYAVVVPGSLGGGNGKPALYCAVILKTVDAAKTSTNELLRD